MSGGNRHKSTFTFHSPLYIVINEAAVLLDSNKSINLIPVFWDVTLRRRLLALCRNVPSYSLTFLYSLRSWKACVGRVTERGGRDEGKKKVMWKVKEQRKKGGKEQKKSI